MKKRILNQGVSVLLLLGLFIVSPSAWARLPKPIQAQGTVLAIDLDTQTLVFKQGRGRKPFLLDWNKDTEFSREGQPASATELKQGATVLIYYKDVSFHNPLLKRVIWASTGPAQ